MPTVSVRRVRSRLFEFENALLRASVDALAAGRSTCRHCHRTPLVGERVHVYEPAHPKQHTEIVCELCRPLRVAAPDRTELVCSAERGASVQAVADRT